MTKNKTLNSILLIFCGFILAAIIAAIMLLNVNTATSNLTASYEALLAEKENQNTELQLAYNRLYVETATLNEVNNSLNAEVANLEARLVEATTYFKDYSTYQVYARDIIALCKVTIGEAGSSSAMQKAAVVWCVLNRVDETGESIYKTIVKENQFHGYNPGWVVRESELSIVMDVLFRWQREKLTGETDPGRVLPKEYTFFAAAGKDETGQLINVFRDRDDFKTAVYWDFSCEDPYK